MTTSLTDLVRASRALPTSSRRPRSGRRRRGVPVGQHAVSPREWACPPSPCPRGWGRLRRGQQHRPCSPILTNIASGESSTAQIWMVSQASPPACSACPPWTRPRASGWRPGPRRRPVLLARPSASSPVRLPHDRHPGRRRAADQRHQALRHRGQGGDYAFMPVLRRLRASRRAACTSRSSPRRPGRHGRRRLGQHGQRATGSCTVELTAPSSRTASTGGRPPGYCDWMSAGRSASCSSRRSSSGSGTPSEGDHPVPGGVRRSRTTPSTTPRSRWQVGRHAALRGAAPSSTRAPSDRRIRGQGRPGARGGLDDDDVRQSGRQRRGPAVCEDLHGSAEGARRRAPAGSTSTGATCARCPPTTLSTSSAATWARGRSTHASADRPAELGAGRTEGRRRERRTNPTRGPARAEILPSRPHPRLAPIAPRAPEHAAELLGEVGLVGVAELGGVRAIESSSASRSRCAASWRRLRWIIAPGLRPIQRSAGAAPRGR